MKFLAGSCKWVLSAICLCFSSAVASRSTLPEDAAIGRIEARPPPWALQRLHLPGATAGEVHIEWRVSEAMLLDKHALIGDRLCKSQTKGNDTIRV